MATHQTSATPDYTMGFGEGFLALLRGFTAEANAAYLLPYLRPGLRVLDFGCGPGTISVGLARMAAPGELHGVDMEESQIELARSAVRANRQDNAIFHVADVTDLPFEDDFFDLAHCHGVLMHVPDTQAALAEVKRVLKPGGIIGCREFICDASFMRPDFNGMLGRAWQVLEDLLSSDDGHPLMGKELKVHMMKAGFMNTRMTASFNVYNSPAEVALIYEVATKWFLSTEITEPAITYGASSDVLFNAMGNAFDRWVEHPGAVAGLAFGEAIANKPYPEP